MIYFTPPPIQYITKPTQQRYMWIHVMRDYGDGIYYAHISIHKLVIMIMEPNVRNYKYVSEKTNC